MIEIDPLRCGIDVARFGQQHARVSLSPQNPANRRRDIAWRQRRRRHLIQQRLKHVMVVAIEQRDAHRRMLQCLRRPEAAETAADDHYVREGHTGIIGELRIVDCGLWIGIVD